MFVDFGDNIDICFFYWSISNFLHQCINSCALHEFAPFYFSDIFYSLIFIITFFLPTFITTFSACYSHTSVFYWLLVTTLSTCYSLCFIFFLFHSLLLFLRATFIAVFPACFFHRTSSCLKSPLLHFLLTRLFTFILSCSLS